MLDNFLQNLLPSLLSPLITSLIGGAASAVITVQLALKRFYKEKHWERKAEAYSSILDALHNIKRCAAIFAESDMQRRDLSKDYANELSDEYISATREFYRRTDVSAYFLNEEARKFLERTKQQFSKIDNEEYKPWELCDRCLGDVKIAEKALKELSEIASKDLKIFNNNWLRSWLYTSLRSY